MEGQFLTLEQQPCKTDPSDNIAKEKLTEKVTINGCIFKEIPASRFVDVIYGYTSYGYKIKLHQTLAT